ncbi:MAG: SDR family oxidoreductase [Lachnospiraceae bacterium]|nr:SDR family oxidoreductase [Lachnospiraceae bacterium]
MKIVITGSSGGIGKAIAEKFLSCGYEVIGLDVCPSVIDHGSYSHILCDISSSELPEIDGTDILINCAGVQDTGRDIDVNLKGTIRVTEKYAFQENIKSVLFIASSSARTGAEFPEYAASKGGMVSYMKNTAGRLAAYGATSNCISPGGVTTSLNAHILENPVLWEKVLAETMLGRWASPEEIAEWAYFVTVVNRSMTAQDILIDNGEFDKCNFIW